MSRGFNGSRAPGGSRLSEAAKLKRLEIMKGGKLPISSAERYKRVMRKKMEEALAKNQASKSSFQLPGSKPAERKMSKTAEMALKQQAAKKAAKEEKAMRQMVVIQPRTFPDAGRIDAKGNVQDLAGNVVLKVNAKNGRITTVGGMAVGKYRAKSMMTNRILTDAIKKYSPYFIKLRQMQLLQQYAETERFQAELARGGVYGVNGDLLAVNVPGSGLYGLGHGHDEHDTHGSPLTRSGATVTGWGVMSNNVHGTHAENVWGGMSDNIWGTTYSNVWGGLGGNATGSRRGMIIWGSGSPGQKNYLKPLWTFFSTLLGFKGKRVRRSDLRAASGNTRTAAGRSAGRTGGR